MDFKDYEALFFAVCALDKTRKNIIGLYYYEQLNFVEIAKILSIKESKVIELHDSAINTLTEFLHSRLMY